MTQPNKANILGVREKIMNILEGKPKQSAIEQEREKKAIAILQGAKLLVEQIQFILSSNEIVQIKFY